MSVPALRVVDSVTELTAQDAGCVAVTGSHGGISSARYAWASRPLICVFNDAGLGLARAGIAGLDLLQEAGLAACAVSHDTARIGEAQSTLRNGVISHANAAARSLGAQPGLRCEDLVTQLRSTGAWA